jgi:hypothetical protein
MKLLFDENLSFRLVEAVAHLFPGSLHITRPNLTRGTSDRTIWEYAQQTAADMQRVSDAHRRFFVANTSTCQNDVCYFDFLYQNSPLARLGLSSNVKLGVHVRVYRGRVATVIMDLACFIKPKPYGVYVMEMIPGDSPDPEGPLEQEGPFWDSNVRGDTTWVRMTPEAPKLQRDRAYLLGLNCFDHIGRCRCKGDLLPAMAHEVVAH